MELSRELHRLGRHRAHHRHPWPLPVAGRATWTAPSPIWRRAERGRPRTALPAGSDVWIALPSAEHRLAARRSGRGPGRAELRPPDGRDRGQSLDGSGHSGRRPRRMQAAGEQADRGHRRAGTSSAAALPLAATARTSRPLAIVVDASPRTCCDGSGDAETPATLLGRRIRSAAPSTRAAWTAPDVSRERAARPCARRGGTSTTLRTGRGRDARARLAQAGPG